MPTVNGTECQDCGSSFASIDGIPAFVEAPPAGMQPSPKKDRVSGTSWRKANSLFYKGISSLVSQTGVVLDVVACPPAARPGRMRVQRPQQGEGLEDEKATQAGADRTEVA